MDKPSVIVSGFADEVSLDKSIERQCAVFAELGLTHLSLRYVDVGQGIKNVLDITDGEVGIIRHRLAENGLRVWSIGSPLGKVKLVDVNDGTTNRYVERRVYLDRDVRRACELAHAFETKLIRGFSFYPPRGISPANYLDAATERVAEIVAVCDREGLTFGLEVEANLVGHTGWILAEMYRRTASAALSLVFDGGNLSVQGFSADEIFQQYLAMKPGLGWLHVKDYQSGAGRGEPATQTGHFVDEESLSRFVPVGSGDSGYDRVFADLRESFGTIEARLRDRGWPGICVELEPHLKQGGQFGGFSGADGFALAAEALRRTLAAAQIAIRA
jgi:sugar phosphate isomerase/epimerase